MSIPNNGLGRPKGSINLATRELKDFWHLFFTSQEYRESAKQRILEGSAPHLENYLFNRIYGKPKESVDMRIGPLEEDFSILSTMELMERAASLMRDLREAHEMEIELQAYSELHPELRNGHSPLTIEAKPQDARSDDVEGA